MERHRRPTAQAFVDLNARADAAVDVARAACDDKDAIVADLRRSVAEMHRQRARHHRMQHVHPDPHRPHLWLVPDGRQPGPHEPR